MSTRLAVTMSQTIVQSCKGTTTHENNERSAGCPVLTANEHHRRMFTHTSLRHNTNNGQQHKHKHETHTQRSHVLYTGWCGTSTAFPLLCHHTHTVEVVSLISSKGTYEVHLNPHDLPTGSQYSVVACMFTACRSATRSPGPDDESWPPHRQSASDRQRAR